VTLPPLGGDAAKNCLPPVPAGAGTPPEDISSKMKAGGSLPCRPVIAFDSAAAHCAAALLAPDGSVMAARFEPMARGQAEALVPLLEEVLAEAGVGWRDLGGIVVGTGPGNFTGIRIAVAAARGLALALGVPAVGVTAFDALRSGGAPTRGEELVCLDAPRGMLHAQSYLDGTPAGAPFLFDPAAPPPPALRPGLVRGDRAREVAALWGARAMEAASGTDIALRIGRIGTARLRTGHGLQRPAPCYVRPADAAAPSQLPPQML